MDSRTPLQVSQTESLENLGTDDNIVIDANIMINWRKFLEEMFTSTGVDPASLSNATPAGNINNLEALQTVNEDGIKVSSKPLSQRCRGALLGMMNNQSANLLTILQEHQAGQVDRPNLKEIADFDVQTEINNFHKGVFKIAGINPDGFITHFFEENDNTKDLKPKKVPSVENMTKKSHPDKSNSMEKKSINLDIPSNDDATKEYVQSLGELTHERLVLDEPGQLYMLLGPGELTKLQDTVSNMTEHIMEYKRLTKVYNQANRKMEWSMLNERVLAQGLAEKVRILDDMRNLMNEAVKMLRDVVYGFGVEEMGEVEGTERQ
jgi:hypothetical protein